MRRKGIFAAMSAAKDLDVRYLECLLELNPSLRHALRNQTGGFSIQLNLILEYVRRRRPDDAEAWEKIGMAAAKAEKACKELLAKAERPLLATRQARDAPAPMDLRGVLADVEELISYYIHEKSGSLAVRLPDRAVALDGSRDTIQRGLLVVLVAASQAIDPETTLELRLDDDGVLEVRGPPAHRWLPRVADIIELIGGGLDAGPQGSTVAIRLPVQTRI